MVENTEEVKSALSRSILTNAKLAKAVEVLMGYHLSTKEKESISKRIDACATLEELDGTMSLVYKELQRGFIDEQTGERWSPKFVEDIKGYYENGFPFNPMAKLSEAFAPIRDFIIQQDVFIKLEDENAKGVMEKELSEKRALCNEAIMVFEGLLAEMGGGGV